MIALFTPVLAEVTVMHGLFLFAVYGIAGVALTVTGYKLFDRFTPGNLHAEIFDNKNVAAAILAGSVLIAISMIIAAAMGG
jgi:putative membrane protein